ncbi:MAG: hypothetical protein HXY44_17545 [Syntrophaceae bacterium]|nr:hypothetical protein [Syntrophaceae bacterium]
MRELGYVDGKNIAIEYQFTEGKIDRLPEVAAELVRLKVDIIVTETGSAALEAKKATQTIPIVMGVSGDKVFDPERIDLRGCPHCNSYGRKYGVVYFRCVGIGYSS